MLILKQNDYNLAKKSTLKTIRILLNSSAQKTFKMLDKKICSLNHAKR